MLLLPTVVYKAYAFHVWPHMVIILGVSSKKLSRLCYYFLMKYNVWYGWYFYSLSLFFFDNSTFTHFREAFSIFFIFYVHLVKTLKHIGTSTIVSICFPWFKKKKRSSQKQKFGGYHICYSDVIKYIFRSYFEGRYL